MSDSLCSLPGHALGLILHNLSHTDRRRLAGTCSQLRQLCSNEVSTVAVAEQDIEDWAEQALNAFSRAKQLLLSDVLLGPECILELEAAAPQLLQRLQSLKLINPAGLEPSDLLQLLSSCPSLTELCVQGAWSFNSKITPQEAAQHSMPQHLQKLTLQRSTNLDEAQLLMLLSAPSDSRSNSTVSTNATAGSDGAGQQSAGPRHSSSYRQELPHWCTAISNYLASCQGCNDAAGSMTAGLSSMTRAWRLVEYLDVTACPKIGSQLALILALCPALQSLCLHSCFKVTDTVFKELSQALQAPSNSNTLDDAAQSSSGANSSQQDTAAAAAHASKAEGTDAGAGSPIGDTIPLRHLDLSYTRVKDAGMPHLVAALPNLQSLGLKGCNVGDDGLDHLLRLQRLTALHIKHCHRVTDEGIQGLSTLSRLRRLSYGYTSMPEADDVVAAIARQFTALTALDLLASELTDTGLSALGKLPQLHELKLYQAAVTAEGLVQLAGQPAGAGLHSLVLYGTGAMRELLCLGAFPSLQQLQLGRLCDLSAPMAIALRDLTAVQHLTSLTLERMDDITVEVLQYILKGCKELQRLRVRGCDGVSEEEIEELAQDAAGVCGSSAGVWWAAAPSCDTDDEEEGWQMMQPY